jgi:hypothetical protein
MVIVAVPTAAEPLAFSVNALVETAKVSSSFSGAC